MVGCLVLNMLNKSRMPCRIFGLRQFFASDFTANAPSVLARPLGVAVSAPILRWPMLSVTELIFRCYQLAEQQQETVSRSWVSGAIKLGGALPDSLLTVSLQRTGRLDAVLRCMEDEYLSGTLSEEVQPRVAEPLASLSETWVGQVYEIIRLTQERKLIGYGDVLKALAHDFRLLRIPMEKHEIAADRSLFAPLQMSRNPPREGDDNYRYDPKDLLRAHIMSAGISRRGSIQWLAVDISDGMRQRWIERRDLSDRVLQLLSSQ